MNAIKIELDTVTFTSDEDGRWSADYKTMPLLNGRVPEADVIATLQYRAKKGSEEAKQMLIKHFPMVGFHS